MPIKTADLIILNGSVLTMNDDEMCPTAVAVCGNRITAVGTDAEILRLAGGETKTVDAQGATVMPGFVESHMHLFAGSFSLRHLQLADVEGVADLSDALLAFADKSPDEGLLIAQGVSYGILGNGAELSRHVLDEIIADRPVFLQSNDLHNAWVNTISLEKAGLLHGADVGANAEIVLGPDGLATGLLKEFAAQETVLSLRTSGGRETLGIEGAEPDHVTPDQRAEDKAALLGGLSYCAAHGITTILNMDGNRYQADLLREMEAAGNLKCRIEVPYTHTPQKSLSQLAEAVSMRQDYNSDKLWSSRVKLFMDGVLDARTAFRMSDYPGYPGECGHPYYPASQFADIATEADRADLQISVHAIGDGAVNAVLNGYETAREANGQRDSRHRIEHIEVIQPDDIARLAALGVVASMQPVHPPGCDGLPLEPTISLIGPELWASSYAWRPILEAGCTVCFSTDWPVSPLSPINAIQNAMTRQPWTDGLADQRLSLADTLMATTRNGAYSAFKEDRFGRILPGLFADIVVLSENIMQCPVADIGRITVMMTVCDGEITHEDSKVGSDGGQVVR
jgi:hypothetical protein